MFERLFDHFPRGITVCPICGKNDDRKCFLIAIDGTTDEEGKICEAQPTHRECLDLSKLQYNREHGLIYMRCLKSSISKKEDAHD